MTRRKGKVDHLTEKRAVRVVEVEGLNFTRIQSTIKWRGMCKLHQLGEEAECLLAETAWPPKTDKMYYVDASTGLLFDKQSGACKQGSSVTLDLSSVQPVKFSLGQYKAWLSSKRTGKWSFTINKRGPKPKGWTPSEDQEPEADDDSREVGNEYAALVD